MVRPHRKVTTSNGEANIAMLPDSGVDICAAGPKFVKPLGEHMDNLASPRLFLEPSMVPHYIQLENPPKVTFHSHDRTAQEDVHIYHSITDAIISWSTAQKLGILPKCYRQPTTKASTVPTSGPSNTWNPSQHTIDKSYPPPRHQPRLF